MKRTLLLSLCSPLFLSAFSQTQVWDGVTVLEHSYTQKMSSNGQYIVGFSGEGGTISYNIKTGKAYFSPSMDYGKGHVVSDAGWVVGCQLLLEDEGNHAYIYKTDEDEGFRPAVFDTYKTSNIHSITPDGSRICGVVDGAAKGYENLPYYCDIDANGNLGNLQFLPFPDKDFFGTRPQYCSATWLSNDGKTILGQVIDSRGFTVYPILYTQKSDGSWEYSLPSEKLFNMTNLPLPEPIKEIEELFPDVPYPNVQDFMGRLEYNQFVNAGEPYDRLQAYMTPEQLAAYEAASEAYWEVQDEYNIIFENYMSQYWTIVDNSVFFTRNAMTLSADGKWMASSASVEEFLDAFNSVLYYEPYVCNLETMEWKKFGNDKVSYHTNQIFDNGLTVVNVISDGLRPASTYLYYAETNEFVSLLDYLEEGNPQYVEWIKKFLTGDVVTGGSETNPDYERDVTFTGQAVFSDDMSVIAGGADGYVLDLNMYFTYIFNDVKTGVEEISADTSINGGIYKVYNLQGIQVMETSNISDLYNLSQGIYVINGKKVKI